MRFQRVLSPISRDLVVFFVLLLGTTRPNESPKIDISTQDGRNQRQSQENPPPPWLTIKEIWTTSKKNCVESQVRTLKTVGGTRPYKRQDIPPQRVTFLLHLVFQNMIHHMNNWMDYAGTPLDCCTIEQVGPRKEGNLYRRVFVHFLSSIIRGSLAEIRFDCSSLRPSLLNTRPIKNVPRIPKTPWCHHVIIKCCFHRYRWALHIEADLEDTLSRILRVIVVSIAGERRFSDELLPNAGQSVADIPGEAQRRTLPHRSLLQRRYANNDATVRRSINSSLANPPARLGKNNVETAATVSTLHSDSTKP